MSVFFTRYILRRSLNRNILECKYEIIGYSLVGNYRLNRNILECKFEEMVEQMRETESLNRNILECK